MLVVAKAAAKTAVFIAALACGAGVAAVSAAELPVKANPVAYYNWTGFYLGLHAGGVRTIGDAHWNPLPSSAAFGSNSITSSLKGSHFAGGLQAGYNWQFAPAWVGGLEADWSWTNASSSASTQWTSFPNNLAVPTSAANLSRKLDWLASARARIGYLVAPQALVYLTGGMAWGRFEYAATAYRTNLGYYAQTDFSSTSTGYVLGGGLEYAIASHWLLRGEYLYYRFGSQSVTASAAPVWPTFPSGFVWDTTSVHSVRAALSYKF